MKFSCNTTKYIYSLFLIGQLFLGVIHSSATVDLNVGAYFEFNTSSRGWRSAGVWPAVHLATEHVNQRNDLLPGYKLKLHFKDTRVCTVFFKFPSHFLYLCGTFAQERVKQSYQTKTQSGSDPENSERGDKKKKW